MDRDGSLGIFRLMRQASLGYFGQVKVRLAGRGVDGPRVVWRVDRQDRGSVQPGEADRVFVDAAVEGAGVGLALVARCGVETAPYAVELVRVWYSAVDIEVASVRAAAAMAVADAFGVIEWMGLSFDERGGGSFGPGPARGHQVGAWTAQVIPGMAGLGPLAASVARSEVERMRDVRAACRNETSAVCVVGDVAVTVDVDGGVLSFAAVSGSSTVETVELSSFVEILTARSWVERGRIPMAP